MAAVVGVLDEVLADEVIDAADVARVLGATLRSVARWQAAQVSPRRESEERLLELKAVLDLARDVMRPESARLWFRSPSRELGYDKPRDLIARGDYRKVIAALLALAEGVTA